MVHSYVAYADGECQKLIVRLDVGFNHVIKLLVLNTKN